MMPFFITVNPVFTLCTFLVVLFCLFILHLLVIWTVYVST